MKKLIFLIVMLATLSTSAQDWAQRLAEGKLIGYTSQFKFGENVEVGVAEEVIWDGGGTYTFLTSADFMKVVSSDADDSLGGAGANTMYVFGLDSNYNEVNELITLDGTDTVTTTTKFLRVFRAFVLTSGTNTPIGDANLGTITISSATAITLQAQIGIGNGQTLMCVYTVPAGKVAYVTGISFGVGQGKECTFRAKFRNGVSGAFSVKFSLTLYQSTYIGPLQIPLRVPEKIDMVITGITASGTVKANASFGMILHAEDQ